MVTKLVATWIAVNIFQPPFLRSDEMFSPPAVEISVFFPIYPFHSQDLISNSPSCLLFDSCNVGMVNLELDQLIIP